LSNLTYALEWADPEAREHRRVWHQRFDYLADHFRARDFSIGARDTRHVALAWVQATDVLFTEIDLRRTAAPIPPLLRRRSAFDSSKGEKPTLDRNPEVIRLPRFLRPEELLWLPSLKEIRWTGRCWEVAVEVLLNDVKPPCVRREVLQRRHKTLVLRRPAESMDWTLKAEPEQQLAVKSSLGLAYSILVHSYRLPLLAERQALQPVVLALLLAKQ